MTAAGKDEHPAIVLLTGEFPPMPGGVADYTQSLATHLAAAGVRVHVIAPGKEGAPTSAGTSYQFHPLRSRFKLADLRRLDAILRTIPGPYVLFIQYVPQAFGYKGVNLPFIWWCYRRRRSQTIWTMFHEVEIGREPGQSLKLRAGAWVTRRMAGGMIRASRRWLISTEVWRKRMAAHVAGLEMEWLPVPSNVATTPDGAAVAKVRADLHWDRRTRVLGHFGTFGPLLARTIEAAIMALKEAAPGAKILLLGRGAPAFAARLICRDPALGERVAARGNVSAEGIADHLAACDVLFQPFPEGATSRRTSLMAGMALGRPIVTTRGPLLEPLFSTTDALKVVPCDAQAIAAAAAELLNNPALAASLGERAAALYQSQFGMDRTVERLLQSPSGAMQ